MDGIAELPQVIAETPVNIVKPAKTFFITSANAAELRKKAIAARKAKELALKQRIEQLEAEKELARPLLEQAVAQATAPTLEPQKSFVSNRLRIVREQLKQLDEQLSQCIDWKATKAICDSIKALTDVERILDNRPLPGSRRPGREKPDKRSKGTGPLDAE